MDALPGTKTDEEGVQSPATLPGLSTGILVDLRRIAALALIYFVAGKFGLTMALFHQSASPIWPPTGISLAALLLFGTRLWPGVWVGAFLVNLTTAGTVLTSVGIATGNTLEAVMGAGLAVRFANGPRAFVSPRDIIRFILLAGVLSTSLSATIGVTSLSLGGYAAWPDYPVIWVTWWLGNMVSAVLITPLIVIWRTVPLTSWTRRRKIEALLMLALVAGSSLLVFGSLLPPEIQFYARPFMALPLLLWSAYRFGPRGAITAVFVLSGIALWWTLRGEGFFVLSSPNDSLLLLQLFVCTITVTNLVLAAAVSESRRVEAELRSSHEDLKAWQRELEARVQTRTAELARANQALQGEMRERRSLEARMARMAEREQLRLGSELHDGLGQRLTGISLLLAELHGRLGDLSSDGARDSLRVQELLDQSIHESQELARSFYPVELERFGLLHSLRDLARRTSHSFGVRLVVDAEGQASSEVKGPAALQLYRIAQEALLNAVEHGKAKHVRIHLAAGGGDITLTVSDDGVGLPPVSERARGMGLRIMEYRAQTIGGFLDLRSGDEGGAVVSCTVPASEGRSLLEPGDEPSPAPGA